MNAQTRLPIGSHARCDVEIKRLRKEVDRLTKQLTQLQAALADCMSYVEVDNLIMQTKYARWKALTGAPWRSGNVEVDP